MQSPGAVAFSIGGIDIMWYGILIATGMLLALIISFKRANSYSISQDDILNVFLLVIPFGVIGARLYYVIFNWEMYRGDFGEMINIRNGGLAIHGGLIAGILAALIYSKYKKLHFTDLLDLLLPCVALAQSIGRWGNFFNSEAHGTPTDLPWAVIVDGIPVHPTFLYESLWCLMLFFLLSYIGKHRSFGGQIACLYGMLYSAERFFVEGLRTDSLMIFSFKQAQVLSISVIIICAFAYLYLRKKSLVGERSNNVK